MFTISGENFSLHPRAVAFDKDGTLVEGMKMWEKIFKMEIETARRMGLDISKEVHALFGLDLNSYSTPLATTYSSEEKVLLAAAIWLSHHLDWSECRKKAEEIIKRTNEELDYDEVFVPINGAQKAIKKISKYVPVAIATSDSRENALHLIEKWNMEDDVDFIITSDDVKNGKPSPDMLEEICKNFKIECSQLLMIGDNDVDVEMAKSAGCMMVSVGRKLNGADGWIEDFTHLRIEV